MCYSCEIFSRKTLVQSTVAFHKLIAAAELITSYWCPVYGQLLMLKFIKLRDVKNPMTPKPGCSASAGASPLLLSHCQMAVPRLPCDPR